MVTNNQFRGYMVHRVHNYHLHEDYYKIAKYFASLQALFVLGCSGTQGNEYSNSYCLQSCNAEIVIYNI